MTQEEATKYTTEQVKNIEFILVADGEEHLKGKGIKALDSCLDFALDDYNHVDNAIEYTEAYIVADNQIIWYNGEDPLPVTMFYDTPDEEFYHTPQYIIDDYSYGQYK